MNDCSRALKLAEAVPACGPIAASPGRLWSQKSFTIDFGSILMSARGLVMGTSLNGVTKKIALIDHLGREDVMQIVALARSMM
ncbi:hypothetical protein [Aquabacterium sp.]|uniref:hypothetical protein n=1 Tax=Aquabacterium sp. TaxID=1872578 RepID=UPI0035AEAD0E